MSMDDRLQTETAGPTTHALAEVARFLQVVRHRMWMLMSCIVVGGMIGGAWYAMSPPKFESSAEILVLKTEGGAMDNNNSNGSNSRAILDVMPTYQKVLSSDVVLEGAIKSLPAKYRGDFKGQRKARWTKILRDSMTVSSTRLTNVLSVRYVSGNPESAARVVGAVVDSYLAFMRSTHRGSAKDALDVLTREKGELENKLREKEQRAMLYAVGAATWRDQVHVAWARSRMALNDRDWRKILLLPERWDIPKFQLKGTDLLARGFVAGPKLGAALERGEDYWIASDFKASRDDILQFIESVAQ